MAEKYFVLPLDVSILIRYDEIKMNKVKEQDRNGNDEARKSARIQST
ncbi:MAG: hypothetical protein ACRC8Y_01995 [Chroococcales cyanobacterium]